MNKQVTQYVTSMQNREKDVRPVKQIPARDGNEETKTSKTNTENKYNRQDNKKDHSFKMN